MTNIKNGRMLVKIMEPAQKFNKHKLTVSNLQETFDSFLERHPDFEQHHLFIEIGHYKDYDNDVETVVTIIAIRHENDDEYNTRRAKEKEKRKIDAENARKSQEKAREKREAKELEEYERLKKKFERK